MKKKKLGRTLSRTYKSDYGKRKNPLPNKLEYLSELPFYAVTECKLPESDEHQLRIEVLPRSMKKLAKAYLDRKEIMNKNKCLKQELEDALSKIEGLEVLNKKLEANNFILMENIENGIIPDGPTMKNHLALAEEKGFIPKGFPLQGGLPGLGKKR